MCVKSNYYERTKQYAGEENNGGNPLNSVLKGGGTHVRIKDFKI